MIIKDSVTDLATPFGAMRTYVYQPVDDGRYPGIIFFSEIFQQTEPVRRAASILAGHGFVVAVPEIFHELNPPGTVLGYDQAGKDKGNLDKITKTLESYDADVAALVDFLSKHAQCTARLGAMGICIGGHLAFRAALHPRILAASCLYATDLHSASLGKNKQDNTLRRAAEISGELLLIWGKQDPHIPAEGRAKIYNALSSCEVNFTWHEFNGQHAFMRDEGERYDPELALCCYRLSVDLFRRRLAAGAPESATLAAACGESCC